MDFHIEMGQRNYNTNVRKKNGGGYITDLYQEGILSYVKEGWGGLKKTRIDRNFVCHIFVDTGKKLVEVIEITDFEKENKTKKDFEELELNFKDIKTRCQKIINYYSDKILEMTEIYGRIRNGEIE